MDKSTKICTSCEEEKVLDLFSKKTSGKLGRDAQCKVCKASYYARTAEARKAAQKVYREHPLHKEAAKLRTLEWRKNNPEKLREHNKKNSTQHYLENKQTYFFKAELRKERVKRATPEWANLEDIFRVYELCRAISKTTGIPHEVDHAIPLQGKDVCGLHVFQNLQIVPQKHNRQKSNTWKRDWE